MKQASLIFQYHNQTYDLVEYSQVDKDYWRVYTYGVHGRGKQVAEFIDVGLNRFQAEHMAKHLLRMWRLGKAAGRAELKEELRNLVDTELD